MIELQFHLLKVISVWNTGNLKGVIAQLCGSTFHNWADWRNDGVRHKAYLRIAMLEAFNLTEMNFWYKLADQPLVTVWLGLLRLEMCPMPFSDFVPLGLVRWNTDCGWNIFSPLIATYFSRALLALCKFKVSPGMSLKVGQDGSELVLFLQTDLSASVEFD